MDFRKVNCSNAYPPMQLLKVTAANIVATIQKNCKDFKLI